MRTPAKVLLASLLFTANLAALAAQSPHETNRKTLGYLRAREGAGPWDLWKTQPLRSRLITLIGPEEFKSLQLNMDPADPMTIGNNVMSSGGNRAHLGGEEEGVLLLDLNRDLIEVLILHKGSVVRAWAERDAWVEIPASIQERLNRWPKVALGETLSLLRRGGGGHP